MISNLEYLIAVESMLSQILVNYDASDELSIAERASLNHVMSARAYVLNAMSDAMGAFE